MPITSALTNFATAKPTPNREMDKLPKPKTIIPLAIKRELYNSDPENESSRLWNMWNGGDGEASDEGGEGWYNTKTESEQDNNQ